MACILVDVVFLKKESSIFLQFPQKVFSHSDAEEDMGKKNLVTKNRRIRNKNTCTSIAISSTI